MVDTLRDARLAVQGRLDEHEQKTERFQASMVSVQGSVSVKGRTRYVWIRVGEMVTQAFNLAVQIRENQPVWVVYDQAEREYVVEKLDTTRLRWRDDWDGDPGLVNHGVAHEENGGDPVRVNTRMLTALKTYVTPGKTSLSVNVAPYAGFAGINGLDLTASKPAAGLARYVLVYLDTTSNTIQTVDGVTTVDLVSVDPAKPELPDGGVASAYVRIDGSQTAIAEADIVEAREFLNENSDGWKFDKVKVVSLTNPLADSASMAGIFSVVETGDIFLADAGVFIESDILGNAAATIVGLDYRRCQVITLAANSVVFNIIAEVSLRGLLLGNAGGGTAESVLTINTNTPAQYEDLLLEVSGAPTTGIGFNILQLGNSSEFAHIVNCSSTVISGGTQYALSITSSAFSYVIIEGGRYDAADADILVNAANATVELRGPVLANGGLSVLVGTVTGWWYDAEGGLHVEGGGNVHLLGGFLESEEISTPATPAANTRGLYAGSDGWYDIDDAGATIKLGGSGAWPADGKAMINTIEYAMLVAAEAAASAGNLVKAGPGTFTELLQVTKAITLRGSSRERTILHQASPGQALQIKAAAVVEDVKATETWGVVVTAAGAGAVLRNVESAATATILNQVAFELQGSCLLDRCYGTATGGTSTNRCVRAAASGITVVIRGGAYSGTEALYVVSGATVVLEGPTLLGTINNSGTVRGWYIDGSTGNIVIVGASDLKGSGSNAPDIGSTTAAEKFGNIYLASGKDVYPGGDAAGVDQRRRAFISSLTTDFNEFTGWTWATYTGFVTPAHVSVAAYPSWLRTFCSNAQGATRAFAYRSSYSAEIFTLVSPGVDVYSGLRMDDGTNNNYVELFLESASGLMKLRYRYAIGGTPTGPIDIWTSQPVQFVVLRMFRIGDAVILYSSIDSPIPGLHTAPSITGWSPSRSGIYHENLVASGDNAERCSLHDFYKQ